MLEKVRRYTGALLKPKLLMQLISMNSNGYLYDVGWVNSYNRQMPVDKDNSPLPWATYSFIDFISERLDNSMDIFEFGSGNSTLWYANRVNSVTSVEHDESWFTKINKGMPGNVNLNYQDLVYDGDYSKFPNTLKKAFDLVIVDGRDRVNCAICAIHSLKEDGVIVIDDTERDDYSEAVKFLLEEGFRKIDFWGFSPGLFYRKCTSLFYKNNNCLDL